MASTFRKKHVESLEAGSNLLESFQLWDFWDFCFPEKKTEVLLTFSAGSCLVIIFNAWTYCTPVILLLLVVLFGSSFWPKSLSNSWSLNPLISMWHHIWWANTSPAICWRWAMPNLGADHYQDICGSRKSCLINWSLMMQVRNTLHHVLRQVDSNGATRLHFFCHVCQLDTFLVRCRRMAT